jgi:hypothetical protein
MIGPEGAVATLLSYVQANMPAKITELQARYSDPDLRPPALYAPSLRERLELNQYPALEFQFQSFGNPKYLNNELTQLTWQIPYKVRVYATERGNSFDQVEIRRKRLLVATLEIIGFDVKLSASPSVWVDFTSLNGQFFGVGKIQDRDNRSIAATYIEMNVIVEEMTEPAPSLAVADTVVVSVHPAQR